MVTTGLCATLIACGGGNDSSGDMGSASDGTGTEGTNGGSGGSGGDSANGAGGTSTGDDSTNGGAGGTGGVGGTGGMDGSSSTISTTDSAVTTGGTGGSTGTVTTTTAGGGTGNVAPCGPAPADNAQGILTSHPQLDFDLGHEDFELLTVNIVPSIALSGIDTLDLYAEVMNIGFEDHCSLLFDTRLDGLEIIVLAEAPPHTQEDWTTTHGCLRPGEVGILTGIQNYITADMIEASTSLEFNMTSLPPLNPLSQPIDAPIVDATIVGGEEGGNLVSGTVTPTVPIYNYGMRFYPRDSRGLLVDELLAFPGDLDSLTPGVTLDFASNESGCAFDDYVFLHGWIYED